MAEIDFPARMTAAPDELVLRHGEIELIGLSIAARATAFAVEAFDVAVDMGRCSALLAAQSTVLLTHCHSDHTAGLVAWLSARARRYRGLPLRIVVPAQRRNALLTALEHWPDLDNMRRRLDLARVLVPVSPGDELDLPEGGRARAFALHHTTTCVGWQLLAPGRRRPRLVVAGDSTVLPFRDEPSLLDAEVAVVDCTFVEPGTRVAARLSGHSHLQEWLEFFPQMSCDRLVLAHLPAELTAERFLELVGTSVMGGAKLVPWIASDRDERHEKPDDSKEHEKRHEKETDDVARLDAQAGAHDRQDHE